MTIKKDGDAAYLVTMSRKYKRTFKTRAELLAFLKATSRDGKKSASELQV